MGKSNLRPIPGVQIQTKDPTPEDKKKAQLLEFKNLEGQKIPEEIYKRIANGLGSKVQIQKLLFPPTVYSFSYVKTDEKFTDINNKVQIGFFQPLPAGLNLEQDCFTFHYDLVLNFESNYELMLYVSLDSKEFGDIGEKIEEDLHKLVDAVEEGVEEVVDGVVKFVEESVGLPTSVPFVIDKSPLFDIYYFSFEFSAGAFDYLSYKVNKTCCDGPISLDKIAAVQAFVVDTNEHTFFHRPFKKSMATVDPLRACAKRDGETLFVPGRDINVSCNMCFNLLYKSPPPPPGKNNFPDIPVRERLLPPTIISSLTGSTGNKTLNILAMSLFENQLNLHERQFDYQFDITLDPITLAYKLIVYISFEKQSPNNNQTLFDIFFFFGQFKNEITTREGKSIPIKDIKTVEVSVINRDPDTSRGTETTVQDTTSN
jgi:hypothetical protein